MRLIPPYFPYIIYNIALAEANKSKSNAKKNNTDRQEKEKKKRKKTPHKAYKFVQRGELSDLETD